VSSESEWAVALRHFSPYLSARTRARRDLSSLPVQQITLHKPLYECSSTFQSPFLFSTTYFDRHVLSSTACLDNDAPTLDRANPSSGKLLGQFWVRLGLVYLMQTISHGCAFHGHASRRCASHRRTSHRCACHRCASHRCASHGVLLIDVPPMVCLS
jgi:hypothetical protein